MVAKSVKFSFVVFVMMSCLAGAASAWTSDHFKGPGTAWEDAANWNAGVVPVFDAVTQSTAWNAIPGTVPTITTVAEAWLHNINVWAAPFNETVMNSGTAHFGYLNIGVAGDGCVGKFTMNGGTLDISTGTSGNGNLCLGGMTLTSTSCLGIYEQNGGTTTVAYNLTLNPGEMHLKGGTLTVGYFSGVDNGVIDINVNGTFKFAGTTQSSGFALVDSLVTTGKLKALGGNGEIHRSFVSPYVVVTATPRLKAYNPSPALGAIGLQPQVVLSWSGGPNAVSRNIYFGTTSPGTFQGNQTGTTFDPGTLQLGQTYYWRVDETDGSTVWTGDVWSFTVSEVAVVENFEMYSNDNALHAVWTATEGGSVSLEKTVTHWDATSVKCNFEVSDNTPYAELSRLYAVPQDWNAGVRALEIWFKGKASNMVVPFYMTFTDTSGHSAKVFYNDPNAITRECWQIWDIDLQNAADQGVNLNTINNVAIGFGSYTSPVTSGSGSIYLDDMRLYQMRCFSGDANNPDINGDRVVDWLDYAMMAESWLNSEIGGGLLYSDITGDCVTDYKDISQLALKWLQTTAIPNITSQINDSTYIGLTNGLVSISFKKTSGELFSLKNLVTNDEYLKTTGIAGNPVRLYVNTTSNPPAVDQVYPYQIQDVEGTMGGTLVDMKNMTTVVSATYARSENAGILTLVNKNTTTTNKKFEITLAVTLPDNDVAISLDTTVKNVDTSSKTVMVAAPYLTGLKLGSDSSTNLGVRLREFGQSRAPAWQKQGDIHGRGWNGQWNAVYEPKMNEGLGIIAKDTALNGKIFHRSSGGIMSVLYFDKITLAAGTSVTYPTVQLLVHKGDWKVTATRYRDWFKSAFNLRPVSPYLAEINSYGSAYIPTPAAVEVYKSQPDGQYSMTSFSHLRRWYLNSGQTDVKEWAFYWQPLYLTPDGTGYNTYDHTYGAYNLRDDLGGSTAFLDGTARVESLGRLVGLYLSAHTCRLDSAFFVGKTPKDFLRMDTTSSNVGSLSVECCAGYGPWQDQVAAQCKLLLQQTGAKYIRLDETLFALGRCVNPVHSHSAAWKGSSELELLRKVRMAMDEVDPNALLLTENANDLFSLYSTGALNIWASGPDIAPLRVAIPSYMGFAYYAGEVESATNGYICSTTNAGSSGGWYSSGHSNLWGVGLEPDLLLGTGDTLNWHTLSHTFSAAIRGGDIALNPIPVVSDSNIWSVMMWKSPKYWLMTAGHRAAAAPTGAVRVNIPELPNWAKYAYVFDTKTMAMRDIELVRSSTGTYVMLTAGFSAVFFPAPDCQPLVLLNDGNSPADLPRGQNTVLTVKPYAPWNPSITSVSVDVAIPGLNGGTNSLMIPSQVTVSTPSGTEIGSYMIVVDGNNVLPLKRWIKVVP